ncbi:hypothetical protein [Phenylobacterium sp. J367]|uniref:hypothetical protein n=1 Tax=Phenylobacterium sp. J367 TaxID=2898435 RepID=UPI002151D8E6|nr:hypothetical protein [Phenylobacterium sp. J367]MCR5876962.1 hypothetical protein [Phenylobacterium sp. J367]MCR5877030.1 hypothetical protein [Phenylobacterium sp. J367]
MEAFTLDTSGYVTAQRATSGGPFTFSWSDLTPFQQGYVEALFASIAARATREAGWRDVPYGFHHLAPETLARILKDCEAYQGRYLAMQLTGSDATWGRYFWADRQNGIYADWPPLTVTLGDDGLIYLREGA